jgi:hypothetical protein
MRTLSNKEIADFCINFVTLWSATVDNSEFEDSKECETPLCDMMEIFCKSQGIQQHSADEMWHLYSELSHLPNYSKEQVEGYLKDLKASERATLPKDLAKVMELHTMVNQEFGTWYEQATSEKARLEKFIQVFYK